jgi:hypothetical protein
MTLIRKWPLPTDRIIATGLDREFLLEDEYTNFR